jgi:hypothetical protein
MNLPVINQIVRLVIKGKACPATCTDVFDGGYGYYFDAKFPKHSRRKFSNGFQCSMPELGENCVADFVSYPKNNDAFTVRFFIPKWA